MRAVAPSERTRSYQTAPTPTAMLRRVGWGPQVDLDRSGALDFSEFLCMLFLWATVGTYTHIFESQNNSNVRPPPAI